MIPFAAVLAMGVMPAFAESVYYVGNSLSLDAVYWHDGVTRLANANGQSHDKGYHFRTGVGLNTIWDEAQHGNQNVFASAPGVLNTALPGQSWDVLTVQPFNGPATEEATAARAMINLAHTNSNNANTRVYLFATAGFSDGLHDRWNNAYTGEIVGGDLTRGYFDAVLADVRTTSPGANLIPAGHVLNAIDLKIRAGEIAGLTSLEQLYRDPIHSSLLGEFVAATTVYATIYKTNPVGMAVPSDFGPISPTLAAQLQQITWDTVVSLQSQTGVPEPTTLGVLALGGLTLLRRSRR